MNQGTWGCPNPNCNHSVPLPKMIEVHRQKVAEERELIKQASQPGMELDPTNTAMMGDPAYQCSVCGWQFTWNEAKINDPAGLLKQPLTPVKPDHNPQQQLPPPQAPRYQQQSRPPRVPPYYRTSSPRRRGRYPPYR